MIDRKILRDCKRIVIKIGSSSITHDETGELNISKLEKLVRRITDLKSSGKDVVLVTSGAIATGRYMIGISEKPKTLAKKQALAAIGQARLIAEYRKLFAEYNIPAAQVLLSKTTITGEEQRENAYNTFIELLELGAVAIVNENDTVSTYEMQFGDNDRLSALVAALIDADLLILLSDIDGLYTDDPTTHPEAKFISEVYNLDDAYLDMGKDSSKSDIGTGGMKTKLLAGRISTYAGVHMVIASANDLDIIEDIVDGAEVGTFFVANKKANFDLIRFLE